MITIPVADAGMIEKTFSTTHDSQEATLRYERRQK